jgi:hypothetical protein
LARSIETSEVAELGDDGEGHDALHPPQRLERFDDWIEAPLRREFEKLLFDTREPVDLLVDGTNGFLENDLLGGCGANDLG